VVSGGHTALVHVKGIGDYEVVGETLDDAAGEAFDKGAKLLGLGYPGGPIIDKVAVCGDPNFIHFSRGPCEINKTTGKFIFSFSGLKTALLYYLRNHVISEGRQKNDIAASYQEAIVDALLKGCEVMHNDGENIGVAGGVSLNSRLRYKLAVFAERQGVKLLSPPSQMCSDNAAMVAFLASIGRGIWGEDAIKIDVDPNLPVVGY